jgi:putative addiction module component (TIGR02574 family)
MSDNADRVLQEALQLSTEERARLAAELIASVDGGPDEDAEAAWAAEIERRARRVLAGQSQGEDWEIVLARIERKHFGQQ